MHLMHIKDFLFCTRQDRTL